MRTASAIIFIASALMLALASMPVSASDAQLYWYYYLDSAQGSCSASLDGVKVYPPWYPGGTLVGGRWVTLSPGDHELTLTFKIEEDRVATEQEAGKPFCVVRLGDGEPGSPPNMPDFYEGEFWVLSIKHPWIWERNYTVITWNNEPMRVYELHATIHVYENGTVVVSGDGYGTIIHVGESSTATTTTTTTTAPSGTTTTTATVNVIGSVSEAVRSNPAAAIAAGAGLAGLLGVIIVAVRRW